jgi:hypothetical protein
MAISPRIEPRIEAEHRAHNDNIRYTSRLSNGKAVACDAAADAHARTD